MSRPSHASWFYHANCIWWGVQIIQFLMINVIIIKFYLWIHLLFYILPGTRIRSVTGHCAQSNSVMWPLPYCLLLSWERTFWLALTFCGWRTVPGITESVQRDLNQLLKRRVDWYDDVAVRLDDWLPPPHYPRVLQRRHGLHDTMHRQRLACNNGPSLYLVSHDIYST